ncbi:3-deoxy-manno-octulosonate cytidylyltransferase [Parvibaculum sedimenti]|uniref:3-deoxy-manno-octulosonate cytidylyltransferase n=1 Tax=Parvibaculum sedimenti TaxID=2608632 RepID=A0A6N6VPT2_9HYPH|nr:3-deoxy-manno-octulosonate cytidylyltransferase [Parvibaculum sedimenti]KAB7742855.1 3-deoxy-manno-octulosonate cytidylyltransferase [Parvibaculum sedimenti]
MSAEPIIVIPARMASTRLPGKPLADIAGVPMIVQVWRRACEACVGRVVVAAAEREIAEAVVAAGGEAVLTDPDLPSGSDRIWQALKGVDPEGRHEVILNVQGDLPTLDPHLVRRAAEALVRTGADISTLACEIKVEEERTNPNVVKAVIALPDGARSGRALYFTRATAPYGEGPHYHHIGLYGYARSALARFVSLAPSPLERREKLEQLRALEAGMSIEVALVDTVPLGVDTPADLEKARAALGPSTAA